MFTKVAIVTGGAQGIGKAIVEILLKDGYKVAILDINEKLGTQTAEEFSDKFGSGFCVFLPCDVTEKDELKECYSEVEGRLGTVTVVVNDAGMLDESKWEQMMDVNLKAVVNMTYIAVDKMRKNKDGNGGTIVNLSSDAGLRPVIGIPTYVASKWGVVGFTTSMAASGIASVALAGDDWGISLLTMCPYFTDTTMLKNVGRYNLDDTIVSPGVPELPCKTGLSMGAKSIDIMRLEDTAKSFQKLLRDNKNGAVMRLYTEHGCAKAVYVQQNWTEL